MNTMPRVNKSVVPTQTDEEKAILDIIIKSDDSTLLAWASAEMDRQMETMKTCHICQEETTSGYWVTCWNCGKPVCDACAVQSADGHFCPSCSHETPF